MGWFTRRHERFLGAALLLTSLALIILSSVLPTYAQNATGDQTDRVTVDFVNADLVQVVRILNDKAKHNIIISDPEIGQKKVTATLTDVPLETALEKIVRSAGCSWRQEDGVYIIGSSNSSEPSASADAALSPGAGAASTVLLVDDVSTAFGKATNSDLHVARREMRVETIKLYNVHPKEMMRILGLVDGNSSTSWSSNNYHKNPDGSVTPGWGASSLTPPLADMLRPDPTVAERSPSLDSEAGQYAFPPTPGYGGTTTPGVRVPTAPTATTGTTATTRPGTTTSTTGTTTTQSSGLLPEGIDFIMPYETDNSLIVRGDEDGISELKSIISLLDVAPKQIWIEARFVSISTSELDSLGINWDVSRMNTSFQTNFNPAGNILIGYASGNVMANLRANMTRTNGKLINAPIVTTMNNVAARIGFSTQVPYLNSTTTYSSTGVPTTASWVDTYSVESYLEVLPRVNTATNTITVFVRPNLADIEKFVPTGDMQLPIVNNQWVETIRRVPNGETIVLGGLIRKNTTETVEKIPLLGDLPIVGPLFRNTQKNVDDKELLIFLTPIIVPEEPVAGTGIGVTGGGVVP